MEKLFDITLQNRKFLHRVLENTSEEDLVKIPTGYRNNIWWNIAHVVVTQQLLLYKLSGLPLQLSSELVDKFKKGSFPDGAIVQGEKELIAEALFSTLETAKADYKKGLFKGYQEYHTSAKVTLRNVEDAIAFNLFHEGLHSGTILSLRKALAQE